jgi:hypothetical protein
MVTFTQEGTYIVEYYSKDSAGNIEDTKSVTFKIDKTAPTGTVSINADAIYATSTAVTLTISASDGQFGSGVVSMIISNYADFAGAAWENYTTSRAWTLTTGDGTKTVYVKFKDAAGLESTAFTGTIILDTTPPTGSISIEAGAAYATSTSVVLTLNASDANGVISMCFSNDGTAYTGWETFSTVKSWILTAGDGIKTVYVKFKDNAGLESLAISDTITLDTTPPVGISVLINADADYTTSRTVTLTLSAVDAIEMCFSNDNVNWSAWTAYNTLASWELSKGDGVKIVYAKFKDVAGLISTAISDTIILDTTAPTLTSYPVNITVRFADRKVTLTVLASDDTSKIAKYEWNLDNDNLWGEVGEVGTTVTYDYGVGVHTVKVRAIDNAGLTTEHTFTITVSKKPEPPFIPGFEALALIVALAVVALVAGLAKKKRK